LQKLPPTIIDYVELFTVAYFYRNFPRKPIDRREAVSMG